MQHLDDSDAVSQVVINAEPEEISLFLDDMLNG